MARPVSESSVYPWGGNRIRSRPIVIKLDQSERWGPKIFKFEEMWLQNPQCFEIIRKAWTRGGRARTGDDYNRKLGSCREDLMRWSRACFGNNLKLIEETKGRLKDIAKLSPTDQLLIEEKVLK